MIELFAKSLAMGLAIAAPLGPIGALCIQRTLKRGFAAGLVGGLGTALADALYASLAAAGFASLATFLDRVAAPLGLAGGAFLLWLAWRAWPRGALANTNTRSTATPDPGDRQDLWATIATTFALTMANPATILSFAAIFAGLGLARDASPGAALVVVAGVFAGSMLWWGFLSGSVTLAHKRLPPGFGLWTARLSSLMMGGFGLWALSQGLH